MNKKNTIIIWIAIVFSCMPFFARAATMSVVSSGTTKMVGQPFRIHIDLDTQGDNINAIQGTISFPADLFTLQSVNDGHSIISFWIEQPEEIASGEVSFSGIVPGGFEGAASSVVELVLDPIAQGSGTIALNNLQLLENDGKGSSVTVTSTSETIEVGPAASNTSPLSPTISLTIPQSFTPVVTQDPNVYGGKYFLAFSTTDKGSGIDYYEVLEVPTGSGSGVVSSWQRAVSPYLLQDQILSSNIYVRAVDNAGNFIVVKVSARYPKSAENRFALWLIVSFSIIVLLLLLWVWHRRRNI